MSNYIVTLINFEYFVVKISNNMLLFRLKRYTKATIEKLKNGDKMSEEMGNGDKYICEYLVRRITYNKIVIAEDLIEISSYHFDHRYYIHKVPKHFEFTLKRTYNTKNKIITIKSYNTNRTYTFRRDYNKNKYMENQFLVNRTKGLDEFVVSYTWLLTANILSIYVNGKLHNIIYEKDGMKLSYILHHESIDRVPISAGHYYYSIYTSIVKNKAIVYTDYK